MPKDRVEAVEKALSLLNCFTEDEQILTLAQLAKKTQMYKSTILRLLKSLEIFGHVTRNSDGRYQLGASLWRLGSLYRKSFDLSESILPALKRLRDLTGKTASFYIRDGNQRVCLYRVNSDKAIRHHLDEGSQLPLDKGAAGRLLLDYTEQHLDENSAIQKQPYYLSRGERDPDLAAMAVPVIKTDGSTLGALTISGLVNHFDNAFEKNVIKVLKREAESIEQALLEL